MGVLSRLRKRTHAKYRYYAKIGIGRAIHGLRWFSLSFSSVEGSQAGRYGVERIS